MKKDAELDRQVATSWREYFKEVHDMKEMFAWVWQELINEKGKVYAKKMMIVKAIGCAVAVVGPWTLSFVFNGLNPNDPNPELIYLGIGLFSLVIIIGQIIQFISMRQREYLFGENVGQLDRRTAELFFEKSLGTHIDESNLLNEANIKKGRERIFQLEAMLLFEGVEAVLMLILPYFALWILSYQAGLIITIMLVIHLSWSMFLNRRVLQVCLPIDKKWRDLHRYLVERLDNVEKVRNFAKEKEEVAVIDDKFQKAIEPDREFWLWFIGQVILRGFVDYGVLIGLICWGAYQVWNGYMLLGLLYPLYGWSRQMSDNLWRLGHIEHQINFVTPSILSMKEALTMPIGLEHHENAIKLDPRESIQVDFCGIGHSYPVQKEGDDDEVEIKPVLTDISFSINPGEKVSVIGSTGAGKTTIMRLLLRYMDPSQGVIRINGHDLRNLDLKSWISLVGYIPQQAQILDGTIRYNMLYGLLNGNKASVNDDELWQTMKLLKIDFGERLTHGLDTKVGRNGIKLSGGEAQRLGLGCAVMKKPKFMIIDEATSSLDATTEKMVQQGLEAVLTDDMGALIVTHRLNTVKRICDKFVLIESNGDSCGRVAAVASSFEELAEVSETFRTMAEDQGIIL